MGGWVEVVLVGWWVVGAQVGQVDGRRAAASQVYPGWAVSRRVWVCVWGCAACAPRVGFGSVPLCRCRARGGPRTSHYATANIRTVTTVGSLNNNSNNSRVGQQLSNVRDFCEH